MNILITNDDGVHFPGLLRLREELDSIAETWVCAPGAERSATSQALTIYNDVYVRKLDQNTFLVEGFPADCVNIGLHGDFFPKIPDLVVSGINKGVNMGQDVMYSGTVGAALHAYVHGVPALAVSCGYLDAQGDFSRVARFVKEFIVDYWDILKQPNVINMNFPVHAPVSPEIKWTKSGNRIYRDSYKKHKLDEATWLVNLGGSVLSFKEEEATDFHAYERGFVAVTPLSTDATDYKKLQQFQTYGREPLNARKLG